MTATLTAATWNLQWKRPHTPACKTMVERLLEQFPDIVCLTEAYASTGLPDGHLIEAEPDYGYPIVERRRKVVLWSREPWEQPDQVGHPDLPTGRFVAGRTMTPVGPLHVVGVCIPWRDAHVNSGRRDRVPWQEHLAYLGGLANILAGLDGPGIVLGDFNQAIPRRSAPADIFAKLEAALGDSRRHLPGAICRSSVGGDELHAVARTMRDDGAPVRPGAGTPADSPRHHSLQSRVGPSSRIPSGLAVNIATAQTGRTEDCTRPNAKTLRINPCNAGAIHRRLSAVDPIADIVRRFSPGSRLQADQNLRHFYRPGAPRGDDVDRARSA